MVFRSESVLHLCPEQECEAVRRGVSGGLTKERNAREVIFFSGSANLLTGEGQLAAPRLRQRHKSWRFRARLDGGLDHQQLQPGHGRQA